MIRYSLEELNNLDFDLKQLFAMRQSWQNGKSFIMKAPRKNSAFLYVEKGKITYTFENGKTVIANEGETVHIPKGSVYESYFDAADNGQPVTLLCEFEAVGTNGHPFVFFDEISVFELKGISDSFYEMIKVNLAPNPCIAKQKSIVFGMIFDLIHHERGEKLRASKEFSSIVKGIIYLETDPLQEKSIAEIADMCNVCVSGFRRLFKEYSGMSPNEYRINEKINKAKKMLASGNVSVQETAYTLDFKNVGYFCKLFKKKTGISPGKYNDI